MKSKFILFIKNLFLPLLVLVTFFGIVTLVYFAQTGKVINFSENQRITDFVSAYYGHETDLVIRKLTIDTAGGEYFFVFPKDPIINALFSDIKKGDPFPNIDEIYSNKILIFEKSDVGLLHPLLTFIHPINKIYEFSIHSTDDQLVRIFDANTMDINQDGTEEIFVKWLEYYGGSGGAWYPAIIKWDNGDFRTIYNFPGYVTINNEDIIDETFFEATAGEGYNFWASRTDESVEIEMNGYKSIDTFTIVNTDIFFDFINTDNDENLELIVAYPMSDWDCHYCEQSWLVGAYEFLGLGFSGDLDTSGALINKNNGVGLAQMHGYSFVPLFGQLNFLIKPTWLDSDSATKSRAQSALFEYINK